MVYTDGGNSDGNKRDFLPSNLKAKNVQRLVFTPYGLVQWFLNTLGWKMMKILYMSCC
jgi:hypothetical protein